MSKAKRGDVVALESDCSYVTASDMKKHYYKSYQLVKAYRVKDGQVLQYKPKDAEKPREIAKGLQRIFTIMEPEFQEKARQLFTLGNVSYDNIDTLKNTIRGAA